MFLRYLNILRKKLLLVGKEPFLVNQGYCPACGQNATFKAYSENLGMDYVCQSCSSRPRERALMNALGTFYPNWTNLNIHESSPLHRGASIRMAKECQNYTPSQYFPDIEYGETKGNVRCENLENLTFEDECFDIHITQDVMEHVARPSYAFREIARTLKPGGAHIFTAPLTRRNRTSKMRALPNEDGTFEYLEPPQYHGNPVGDGALVTVDWGYDICRHIFDASGLFTIIFRVDDIDKGIRSPRTEVFVTIKPQKIGDAGDERSDTIL